ncbi:MAG: penicillin binding protein [Clostridia bacterium]|nr:penicillin binding protein [Clostridia bacterium]
MKEFTLTVLNMSISGAIVILAILLARLILKKAPKKWSYLLWGAAAFRLCCPVSIKSAISLFNFVPKAANTAENASNTFRA